MEYFEFILRNLPLEKSDSSFKDALHRARGLIKLYVPQERKMECNRKMFNMLMKISSENNTSTLIKN